ETILVYKLPKLTREEIKHMIGVQDIDLRQTRFYQDVFTEGRQEGRQEGERIVLQRQLERKFGPLDAGMQQRLSQADADTVLMWSDRILDARNVDEVFAPVS
ncbi:MAG TPA: DUF4351 domain-containing protein, partial [Rhodocyclaceae bacterium]|nr:DUF4351 domain-containing protein [Rhodocyclaceae bacterium]